jgi:hypothetical protein
MIVDVKVPPQESQAAGARKPGTPMRQQAAVSSDDSRIDEMSDSSFPASDPPSAWTWEVSGPTGSSAPPANRQ